MLNVAIDTYREKYPGNDFSYLRSAITFWRDCVFNSYSIGTRHGRRDICMVMITDTGNIFKRLRVHEIFDLHPSYEVGIFHVDGYVSGADTRFSANTEDGFFTQLDAVHLRARNPIPVAEFSWEGEYPLIPFMLDTVIKSLNFHANMEVFKSDGAGEFIKFAQRIAGLVLLHFKTSRFPELRMREFDTEWRR